MLPCVEYRPGIAWQRYYYWTGTSANRMGLLGAEDSHRFTCVVYFELGHAANRWAGKRPRAKEAQQEAHAGNLSQLR